VVELYRAPELHTVSTQEEKMLLVFRDLLASEALLISHDVLREQISFGA
jgi:hypothetical protein